MKDEETIKEFLKEMATQDPRATAFPYYYVIRDFKRVVVPEGCGGDEYYRFSSDDYDFISVDEYEKLTQEEKEDIGIENEDELEITYMKYEEYTIPNCVFLTEKDAEEHLKRNHYHYTETAHTYVECAWRCNDFEEFLKALFRHFGVEHPQIY